LKRKICFSKFYEYCWITTVCWGTTCVAIKRNNEYVVNLQLIFFNTVGRRHALPGTRVRGRAARDPKQRGDFGPNWPNYRRPPGLPPHAGGTKPTTASPATPRPPGVLPPAHDRGKTWRPSPAVYVCSGGSLGLRLRNALPRLFMFRERFRLTVPSKLPPRSE